MSTTFAPSDFLDLEHTAHRVLFEHAVNVWDALDKIAAYLKFSLKPAMLGELVGLVEHGAMIKGPAWIGANCQVRSGCYVRENVLVGDGAVLGNSCEFKNCLLFDGAQVPHFNYVGDSILGYRSHLGAGAILSNVKLDHGEIFVEADGVPRIGDPRRPRGDRLQRRAQPGLDHRTALGGVSRRAMARRAAGGQPRQGPAELQRAGAAKLTAREVAVFLSGAEKLTVRGGTMFRR